jgi:tetratricopeptide (TPR) repeat protein
VNHAKQNKLLRDGMTHHAAGRLARAETIYRKILDQVPGNADAAYLLAETSFAAGRPDRARHFAKRALNTNPKHSGALCLLGNVAFAAGDKDAAQDAWLTAIGASPRNAVAHVNVSLVLSDRKDAAGAEQHARAAVEADPAMMRGHYALGYALLLQGKFAEAETALRAALVREPENRAALRELSVVLTELHRPEEALVLQDALRQDRPDEPGLGYARATTLSRLGRQLEAEAAFEAAAATDGGVAAYWSARAMNLRILGQFDDARECFRRALAIDPDEAAARFGLADTGGAPEGVEQIAVLRAIKDDPSRSEQDRIDASFGLGRTLDARGERDSAFAAYREGNDLMRRRLNAAGLSFDASRFRADVEHLQRYWSAPAIRAAQDTAEPAPMAVFVTGMPRSGTTLVEQIAASHPLVHGAGELNDVTRISIGLFTDRAIEETPDERSLELAHVQARLYLNRLRELGGGAERVIDKQTESVFHLGSIAALLPGARVVLCRRDPRDAALSCFFQRFSGMEGEYTDMDDIAAVATLYAEATEHWCRLAPLPILVVDYESLVHDLETGSRRIIDFLGLQWDPACLRFHELARPVATASAWQVRQPAYTSAVGRWRGYAHHLPASLHTLAETLRP